MATAIKTAPNWDLLYEAAAGQGGYFTTQQAADAGYSVQLLKKHLAAGRLKRVRRGIYRVVHFPAGEHEDLIEFWLWSDHAGVFSHETALALHDLSDALPSRAHLTVPARWAVRRLRVPGSVALHFLDVTKRDRAWVGPVPVTSPVRTLADCIEANVQPDLIRQALTQAVDRGMIGRSEAATLRKRLNGRRA
jgi:predicted transcriptional regulator of viral defense system